MIVLIFIALALLAIGASVAFFFVGRRAGKTEFQRYVRKNPKPLVGEDFFGISAEIDRRIGLLQKWISVRKDTKADVSGACTELMKLFDLRQYLALSEIRDRAAARLYAKDFLQKRTEEIYDLYAELYGSDVAARTIHTATRQTNAVVTNPPTAETSANGKDGAAAETQTTVVETPNANPAPQPADPAPNGGK